MYQVEFKFGLYQLPEVTQLLQQAQREEEAKRVLVEQEPVLPELFL
jgi:hypothetical protein